MNESSDPQFPPNDGEKDDTPDECPDSTLLGRTELRNLLATFEQDGDPCIADYLKNVPQSQRLQVLGDLIPVDLEGRWKRCQSTAAKARIEDYFTDWPDWLDWRADTQVLRDLIHFECALRFLHEDQPTLDELQQRFPKVDVKWRDWLLGKYSTPSWLPATPVKHAASGASASGDDSWPSRFPQISQLGEGSFGEVFLCDDLILNRKVAVKRLTTADGRTTWLKEARAAAEMKHPSIVTILDVIENKHERFIVYEFVDGTDLKKRLKNDGPLNSVEAAQVVAAVADALGHAHERGLVHRDIKPANILIDKDGKAYLTDFGLALGLDSTGGRQSIPAGTPVYMSPEQVLVGGYLDGRSDIFSLGAVLYEALCGLRPFDADSPDDVIDQILHKDPQPLRQRLPSIHPQLESICLKSLSKNSRERYQTAVDLANALLHCLASSEPTPAVVAPSRLTAAPERLVGRDDELRRLGEAWGDSGTHVVSIIAWGGTGKTSLVAKWAGELAKRGYDGASYFDWSFYSQGTREQAGASSDSFIAAALEFFGATELAGSPASAWDKGGKLAELVAARRTLLILDGLEPLQYPPGPLAGQLKDPAVKALLRGLAARNPGLCLVTTREPLADLSAFRDSTAPEWPLAHLPLPAGVELLKTLGARGTAAEFEQLVRDVKGHALTLSLLGNYLRDAHGGDIRQRGLVRLEDADHEVQGGHAFRVMDAYVTWFKSSHMNRPLTSVLRLMGLFDRPADAGCVSALRKAPAIPGLTEPLVNLTDAEWNLTLSRLVKCGLVSVESGKPEIPISKSPIDCHPLVREYFARRLRVEHPAAWREAHGRLFEFLCGSVEYQPDTLERLQPLYQAVAYGCLAGRQQEAWDNVHSRRIKRGNEHYSTQRLGAFGSELGVIASFFERPWSHMSPALTEPDQALLLNAAAVTLTALGRLTEALEPMRAGLEMTVAQKHWVNAARAACNLSDLELTLGSVSVAVRDAQQAVAYADRSGDEFLRLYSRTPLAAALHQLGNSYEALALFHKVESLQAAWQPKYPLLYTLPGFRFCDLLLTDAECAAWQRSRCAPCEGHLAACRDIEERIKKTLQWATKYRLNLLTIALDHLTLSRASLYRALLDGTSVSKLKSQIQNQIATAVDGLRRAGHQQYLPLGLITRAWQRAVCDDLDGARADLDEAWEIAERGPMPLVLADIHLYRARLFGRLKDDGGGTKEVQAYPWQSPQHDLAEARRLIETHGYHRRDEELAACSDLWTTGQPGHAQPSSPPTSPNTPPPPRRSPEETQRRDTEGPV